MASFLRRITLSFSVKDLKGAIFETAIVGPGFIVVIVSGCWSQRPSTLPIQLDLDIQVYCWPQLVEGYNTLICEETTSRLCVNELEVII